VAANGVLVLEKLVTDVTDFLRKNVTKCNIVRGKVVRCNQRKVL
jgi:hypothetical protein